MAGRDGKPAFGIQTECGGALKHVFLCVGSVGIFMYSHKNLLFPTLVEKKYRVKRELTWFPELRQRLRENCGSEFGGKI